MQLNELMAEIDGEYFNMQNVEVLNMEFDSRRVTPGTLYIALRGERFDGHDFVTQAQQKGAIALLTQRYTDSRMPQIVVRDTRCTMGVVGRRFYTAVQKLDTIGITGTNGKTTTAFMLHSILGEAGSPAGRAQPATRTRGRSAPEAGPQAHLLTGSRRPLRGPGARFPGRVTGSAARDATAVS